MLIRSYASEPRAAAPAWVAFIRQQQATAFTFTVLVIRSSSSDHGSCSSWAFERVMEASDLEEYIEELGLQIDVSVFVDLLLKTLESRANIEIEFKTDHEINATPTASLLLTYKFSDTISRKGIMALQLVATDPPQQFVSLLEALHGSPNKPILSELQQAQSVSEKETIRATTAMAPSMVSSMVLDTSSKPSAPAVVETQEATTASTLSKKRRLVPSGVVRRKGPRGAILARPSK